MPAAPAKGTPDKALARSAPTAMPGQYRAPHKRRAASATPAGGQAEDTTPCATAATNPRRAAMKYTSARSATPAAYGSRRDRGGAVTRGAATEVAEVCGAPIRFSM